MAGPILYSTNPWFSHHVADKYFDGVHFAWCSEYYDPATAPPGSADASIDRTSSPKAIYEALHRDCENESGHSELIKRYKKIFRRLANDWFSGGVINDTAHAEILTMANTPSWKIWRPVLYVIPKAKIVTESRLISVPRKLRASIGPELQIRDLKSDEFDLLRVL